MKQKKILVACLVWLISVTACFAAEQLIIEPDNGRAPLLQAIATAHSAVDVAMYGFTDKPFIQSFIAAKNQHKSVRILLQEYPYQAEDENSRAITALQAAQVPLRWPDKRFRYLHQKTFLLDHRAAIVMTFNLTYSSFSKERNFALVVTDPAMVQEIQAVFTADWQHQPIQVHQPGLIWSPDNSRAKLLAFIRETKGTLDVYAESVSDYEIVGALAEAARKKVRVRLLLSTPKQSVQKGKWRYLQRAGVRMRFSRDYIIHAKTWSRDNMAAVIGSINLTKTSLDENRELSVITQDRGVIRQLNTTFEQDWQRATSE